MLHQLWPIFMAASASHPPSSSTSRAASPLRWGFPCWMRLSFAIGAMPPSRLWGSPIMLERAHRMSLPSGYGITSEDRQDLAEAWTDDERVGLPCSVAKHRIHQQCS
mmetsp:Transcript_127787/g.409198  ORF Transcript_127787/g.409198 Transcript_127787/m.409198 type:complete len:107 (+) Transcript_127787:2764-3084(+)